MYEYIPSELKSLKQWVCWQALPDESRPGKIKKIPINPRTGGQAQSNNPETWADFQTVFDVSGQFSGIGFMFANGYFGVDIDDAEDAIEDFKAGDENNIISEFIHSLQSYSEYSVSGKGIHIICKGELPPSGRRKKNVEMYQSGRFFVMTGNIAAEYLDITDCTDKIKMLHEKYIGGGSEPAKRIAAPAGLTDLSAQEVIEMAKKSKQGEMFSNLYVGSYEGYFQSQSEADMSFCNMLAFWCRRDRSMMDSVFRTSGLMREKWDRKQSGSTYGEITIKKAAEGCKNVYEPKQKYSITIGSQPAETKTQKIYSFDDTGNAERIIEAYGDKIRYSYIAKSWMYYDGRKWCYDITGVIRRMVDEVVESMRNDLDFYLQNCPDHLDTEEYEKQFFKHMKISRSNKAKTSMLKESEHRVPILPEQLDKNISILNTPNGIINLRTGELLPHDAGKYITKITYTEYTDKIDYPLWERFLNDIFGSDRELIRYVQKAIGYSLTGSTAEHCVFFCYGNGRNGKSTFLDIISDALGDYSVNIQPETIMVKPNNNSNTGDIARLKGARFVTSVEPNEGVRLNEGLLKQLTGGDRVTACKKYENEFEFTPEFKLWMATNHKPIIRGTDVGIWSRIHLIPFTVQIPEEKKDKNLKYKLKKELPAILKWAVDGCLLWQSEGLAIPQAVIDATKDYKNEMDVISGFLDECCTICGGETKSGDLYQAYREWAKENGEYEMSNTRFGREISKRFEKKRSNQNIVYKGVSLNVYNVKFGA